MLFTKPFFYKFVAFYDYFEIIINIVLSRYILLIFVVIYEFYTFLNLICNITNTYYKLTHISFTRQFEVFLLQFIIYYFNFSFSFFIKYIKLIIHLWYWHSGRPMKSVARHTHKENVSN